MKNNQNTKIIPKASLHSINKNDTEEQVAMLDKDDHIDEILVAAAKASANKKEANKKNEKKSITKQIKKISHEKIEQINDKFDDLYNKFKTENHKTLDSIRLLVENSKIKLPENLPPMASGLVGYLGYDTIKLVENIPSDNPSKLNLPDGMFVRPKVMIIFDAVEDTMTIITPIYLKDNKINNYKKIYKKSCKIIDNIVNLLKQPNENKHLKYKKVRKNEKIKSNFKKSEYIEIINPSIYFNSNTI